MTRAVRGLAARMPTYITLKDVKKRWGHGQEDVFPVAQFEKLWGDMTALPELTCRYVVVPRARGQQLKEPAQLDGWLRDGSAAYVESLCDWNWPLPVLPSEKSSFGVARREGTLRRHPSDRRTLEGTGFAVPKARFGNRGRGLPRPSQRPAKPYPEIPPTSS